MYLFIVYIDVYLFVIYLSTSVIRYLFLDCMLTIDTYKGFIQVS